MRKLVYALIRLRIRTLYPEPFIRVLWRSTMFRALLISFVLYTGLYIWFLNIEIRPRRQVGLDQDISVTVSLPPPDIEEDLPGALIAGDDEDSSEGPGEGVFTPESERALEQIKGTGGSNSKEDDTQKEKAVGSDEISREGYIKKDTKDSPVVTLRKKESDKKPEIAASNEERPEEEEPVEQPDEDETDEESTERDDTEKDSGDTDSDQDTPRSPVEIVPAHIIDRPPEVSGPPEPKIPTIMKSKVVSRNVRLRVFLDSDGQVRDIDIVESGGLEFDEKASNWVLNAEFSPARVGPLAVPSAVELTIHFESYVEEEE